MVELNEAFAAQAVAVIRDAKLNPEVVNPNGGAIALGHPVGATGAILTFKALYHLRRQQLEWALVTMCIGGGQAVAAVVGEPIHIDLHPNRQTTDGQVGLVIAPAYCWQHDLPAWAEQTGRLRPGDSPPCDRIEE